MTVSLTSIDQVFEPVMARLGLRREVRDNGSILYFGSYTLAVQLSQDRYYKDGYNADLVRMTDGQRFATWLIMKAVGDLEKPSVENIVNFVRQRFVLLDRSQHEWINRYDEVNRL